jgi:cystathionine beta-lyase
MNSRHLNLRPATLCIHAGTHVEPGTGGVNSPIFTSTAFAFPNPTNQNVYPRYFNAPNQQVIGQKLAALEQGEEGLVFGSGMAAIATVLFGNLAAGDHAVFQSDLYGGTYHLVAKELPRFGIEISFASNRSEFADAIRPNTRLIYVESPSNPLLRCVDIRQIAHLGRERGILTVIDNTFATPINQTPLQLGLDVVVHSGTKYLNGHSDGNSGVVVTRKEIVDRLRASATSYGGMLDAQSCYLLERGLKTLALRVREHNENAIQLARFLDAHPAVERVLYPGLPDHPDHPIAAGQMQGFGGMLSFELKDATRTDQVLSKLCIATPALSLGGVETLVCVPSRTSHRTMTFEERQRAGISDGLVRVSVGVEDIADLKEDFGQALR